jgi:hypothetical protein
LYISDRSIYFAADIQNEDLGIIKPNKFLYLNYKMAGIKMNEKKTIKKSAPQTAKGKMRASKAQRDAKGKFMKAGQPDSWQEELFAVQPDIQPDIQPGTQPEGAKNIRSGQNPAGIQPNVQPESSPASSRMSSLYVTAAITPENDAEKKRRPFERFILSARKDTIWKELVAMKTGLPLLEKEKETEIVNIFIRHAIIMGRENNITSTQEAKYYFANFTRKYTVTHRAILEELQQAEVARRERQTPNPYEDFDPITGQRSYCGIPIPQDAPPRPNENMVWNKESDMWEQ